MAYLIGFVIAALIGLTGVGAGTLTAPVLILFFGIAPAQSVGTALLFGAVTKIAVVPIYLARHQVNRRVLWLLCLGGIPGVLAGYFLLEGLDLQRQQKFVLLVLGPTVLITALYSLYRSIQAKRSGVTAPAKDRSGLLPILAAAIGTEVGFSSAGAGALGSLALLFLTPLTPAQVIGTDLSFGLVLSLIGGGLHIFSGHVETRLLLKLISGGLIGAIVGANLSALLPSKPLRIVLSLWLASLGGELCWKALA